MKKIFLLCILISFGCTAQSSISKIVFENYTSISSEGKKAAKSFQDSVVQKLAAQSFQDSSAIRRLLANYTFSDFLKSKPKTNIVIEIKGDTIWRYSTQNDKMIGDYIRVDREKEMLFYHAKKDKSIIYNKYNPSGSSSEYNYEVQIYKEDKKVILGFDCYKLVIRRKEKIESMPFGADIYEMYVTDKIDLPLYALSFFGLENTKFFPLEIKKWGESLKGVEEIYRVKTIE